MSRQPFPVFFQTHAAFPFSYFSPNSLQLIGLLSSLPCLCCVYLALSSRRGYSIPSTSPSPSFYSLLSSSSSNSFPSMLFGFIVVCRRGVETVPSTFPSPPSFTPHHLRRYQILFPSARFCFSSSLSVIYFLCTSSPPSLLIIIFAFIKLTFFPLFSSYSLLSIFYFVLFLHCLYFSWFLSSIISSSSFLVCFFH